MNVLVTGGTGFIGQALLPALLAAGHDITVLTRNPQRARELGPDGVRWIERLQEIDTPPDAVINLAGEGLADGRWTPARKSRFLESRVGTTQALIEAMRSWQTGPRVLVSGSAIGWYGAYEDEKLTESAEAGSGFASELCQRWEQAALRAETLGARVCRLRIGVVLGLPGGALGHMLPPFRLGLGGRLGNGRQWMSWIHRDDLVALILWLLDNDSASGVYNGTAPQPVTNREFTATLGKVLKRPTVFPVPAIVLRVMFGEMAEQLLLSSQRVLPAHALAQGFTFRYPQLEAALRQILA